MNAIFYWDTLMKIYFDKQKKEKIMRSSIPSPETGQKIIANYKSYLIS